MRKSYSFASRSETRSFKINLTISALEGLSIQAIPNWEKYRVEVKIELTIPRKSYLPRRAVERNHTSKQFINSDGCIHWNEDFKTHGKLKLKDYKNCKSWKVNLQLQGTSEESNSTASVLAKLKVDIAEFIPSESSLKIVKLPIKCCFGGSIQEARIIVKLGFSEVQAPHLNMIVHPLSPSQLLPSLSSCVSIPTQTESNIDKSTSESEEETEPYRSLITTKLQMCGIYNDMLDYGRNENWEEDEPLLSQATQRASLIRFLSWNNRRLKFRVPDHPRDTPLLDKAYSEEGGDDIDKARRCHLSSLQPREEHFGVLGSDRFEIGKWEKRKLKSRDGKLELVTEIFLASIDQRSEKASGEGACTVLAAVIADWLHQNPENLPLRCQFDKLIREGSSEWRKLCKEDAHMEKFSDQHFDLDTVLQAQVRPLMVVPEKSYVGFFTLENMPNNLEFLQGLKSFDSIWEEIQNSRLTSQEHIYIVSWNDHFFILKIGEDTIYVIDTLGERLCEGCKKAYILKFNKESEVYRVQTERSKSEQDSEEGHINWKGKELICKGKSCCKNFIKGFLAALPLRELQDSIERGITGKVPPHHLLQIEFQYMTPCNTNSPTVEIKS